MLILTYALFNSLLNTDPTVSGVEAFPPTYKEDVDVMKLAHAANVGILSSALVYLLAEYFTSVSCPAARDVSD
jgi:hypothetical protein